jgi:hypothetical protein
MRRKTRAIALLTATATATLTATVLGGGTAHAQQAVVLEQPRQRQGYYLSLGFAGVTNYNNEDGGSKGVWNGSAWTIRLGQMVTRRFGLGLQIDTGLAKRGTESAQIFALAVEAQVELWRTLALHGGVGLGVVGITDTAVEDAELRGAAGAGFSLGLSYDFFPLSPKLTGGFALTPLVQARFIPGDDVTALVGMVGVQVTYWTGLPRNQLELPPSEAFTKKQ